MGGSPKGVGLLAWPGGDLPLGTNQCETLVCAKDVGLFGTEEAPADTLKQASAGHADQLGRDAGAGTWGL